MKRKKNEEKRDRDSHCYCLRKWQVGVSFVSLLHNYRWGWW